MLKPSAILQNNHAYDIREIRRDCTWELEYFRHRRSRRHEKAQMNGQRHKYDHDFERRQENRVGSAPTITSHFCTPIMSAWDIAGPVSGPRRACSGGQVRRNMTRYPFANSHRSLFVGHLDRRKAGSKPPCFPGRIARSQMTAVPARVGRWRTMQSEDFSSAPRVRSRKRPLFTQPHFHPTAFHIVRSRRWTNAISPSSLSPTHPLTHV